jgi:V/A-type H+-transporting ATPase subunit F
MFLVSDSTDTLTGLRLVGVEGVMAQTREELAQGLAQARQDTRVGIVGVTGKLFGLYPDVIKDFQDTWPMPLVVHIPDRHTGGQPTDFLSEYMREAMGI